MSARLAALRCVLLLWCLVLLGGCAKDKVIVLVADNHPTVNLFGFEESELHHIQNTVELHRNVFLVRYDPAQPNALEWINCPIATTYQYQEAKGRRVESIYVRSFQELQAKIPVNYARFAGYVKNGKALEFNYVTIGSYELTGDFRIPKDDPDCAGATHYVVTLSVGAFDFSEEKQLEGGVEVAENTTGIGVGAAAGRGAGERTAMGDLASCMDETAAVKGCFTPLQLMMMPLAERHWRDAGDPQPQPQPRPNPAGGTEVATDLSLSVDQNSWAPGSYMAMALQKLLLFATHVDLTTEFGFDEMASTVVAGYLVPDKPQVLNRPFEAGKTYVVAGASAVGGNIDIVIADHSGNVIASDTLADSEPVVTFTPPSTGNYLVQLSLVGAAEEFGALVIMHQGGTRIPAEILQDVFQRLLDYGTLSAKQVADEGISNGLEFHEGDWCVQGTILYPGETIDQTGIVLDSMPHVFGAVSHDESFDIDLGVFDTKSEQSWIDNQPDAYPRVVVWQPDPNTNYTMRVGYNKGASTDPTLATSLILRVAN